MCCHECFCFELEMSSLPDECYLGIECGQTDVCNYEECCHTSYPSLLCLLFLGPPSLCLFITAHSPLSKPPTNLVCQKPTACISLQRLRWSFSTAQAMAVCCEIAHCVLTSVQKCNQHRDQHGVLFRAAPLLGALQSNLTVHSS